MPRDTVLYVQVPSLERLVASALRTRNAFDPKDSAEPIDAEHLLKDLELPGAVAEIDLKRPIAVCWTMGKDPGSSPQPVFLVPVRSPEAFVKSLAAAGHPVTSVVNGTYVLVAPQSTAIELEPAAAPIALNLPSGDLVARIDLGRLIEQFRPMIDPLLDQVEEAATQAASEAPGGMNTGPVMGMYMDGFRDFLDSAQMLDVAVRLEGERMELGLDLANKAGSVLASFGSKEKTDLRALARFFDTNSAMNLLAGADMLAMNKRFHPLFEVLPEMYPEPMRAGIKQMLGHMDEFAAQVGSALAGGGDFGPEGMRFSYFLHARDASKLVECYKAMLNNVPGLILEPGSASAVDGVPVLNWRMRFDSKVLEQAAGNAAEAQKQMQAMMQKLYGKDGLALRIAVKGDVCVLVMGGDEAYLKSALARASAAAPQLPASVQRALDQVGGMSPCFVMHYDMGKVMKGASDLMGSIEPNMAEQMPELPFSILAWGGVDGPLWHGALGCDLGEIGTAMRSVEAARVGRAKHVQAMVGVHAVAQALDAYAMNNSGKFPDSLQPLAVKDVNGQAYLAGEHPLTDPWGREYLYEAPHAGTPKPRVSSLGRDGKAGGTGEDADVQSD